MRVRAQNLKNTDYNLQLLLIHETAVKRNFYKSSWTHWSVKNKLSCHVQIDHTCWNIDSTSFPQTTSHSDSCLWVRDGCQEWSLGRGCRCYRRSSCRCSRSCFQWLSLQYKFFSSYRGRPALSSYGRNQTYIESQKVWIKGSLKFILNHSEGNLNWNTHNFNRQTRLTLSITDLTIGRLFSTFYSFNF